MAGSKDFFDQFYTETMTEMAGNFFSRRKEMEARLDGFQRLAAEVKAESVKALRRWGTLFTLLVDTDAAVGFLAGLGLDASAIPGLASAAGDPWRFKPLFAFSARGRYRKSVRYAFEAAREATAGYNQGAWGTDPRNPRRKILLPNFDSLKALSERMNAEVDAVNKSQTPSAVLAYCKSLDPSGTAKENTTGGLAGEDICRIDRELAFKHIDFAKLALPVLPDLPHPDTVEDRLDRLAEEIYSTRRSEAEKALRSVTG